jgi:hypothetical protein
VRDNHAVGAFLVNTLVFHHRIVISRHHVLFEQKQVFIANNVAIVLAGVPRLVLNT